MGTEQPERESRDASIEALQREVERLRVLARRDRGVLEAILRHSPHGIIVCNRHGTLVLHNEAAERIWGGSASTRDVHDWERYRAFHADGRPYAAQDWSMARCLSQGEVVEAEEIRIQRFDGTHAVILGSAAPIYAASGELEGAVCVFADITRFKATEHAASALADRLATAHRETETLLWLTERANRASSAEEVYEPTFDAMFELFDIDRAAILLFDAEGVLRFRAIRHLSASYRDALAGHSPWPFGNDHAEPIVVADVFREPSLAPYREAYRAEGIRSAVFVPLVHRMELLGKFSLFSAQPRRFSERELSLAQAVATQVAQAVARGNLLAAERAARARAERSAERTRRLERVTAGLSTALEVSEIASIVIHEGAQALDAMSGALWLIDAQGERLELVRSTGYTDAARDACRVLPLAGTMPIAEAARSAQPVWLSSRQEYRARFPESEAKTRPVSPEGPFAIACLPLVSEGRAVGAIAFTFRDERSFEGEERSFVLLLAQYCSQGMHRARLYEQAQEARARAELAEARSSFLAEASAVLGSSLAYETTLRNVADLAVPRMADWCAVDIVDDNGASIRVAVSHTDPAKVAMVREAHQAHHQHEPDEDLQQVIRTGQPLLFQRVTDELLETRARNPEHLAMMRSLSLHSAMIVPIRGHERVFGTISFISAESKRTYGRADLDMAVQLGARAGVAIENAHLYDEAVQAVALRDDFLSIAGHELRTPLTALTLQAHAIARLDPEKARDKLTERTLKLVRHAERLGRLIDQLLDVSRISAGRLTLEREPVDLAALVHEVAGRASEELARSGSTLKLDVQPMLLTECDRTRIEQVVTNLFSNAIKYGDGAPVEVALRQADGQAVLTVRDHGIGIPPEDQARIFARFERAVSSRHYGGLGLGLWIVRQIIEAHGGSIGVESEPGRGALFTVRLPLA